MKKLEDKNPTKTGSQLTMGQVGSWWFPRFGHFPNWGTAALWVYWRVYPPGKLTWLWITHLLKLYFLLKMGIFQFSGVYYLSKPINCPLIRDCAAVHHGGAHSKQPKDATKKCWMILKVFPFWHVFCFNVLLKLFLALPAVWKVRLVPHFGSPPCHWDLGETTWFIHRIVTKHI